MSDDEEDRSRRDKFRRERGRTDSGDVDRDRGAPLPPPSAPRDYGRPRDRDYDRDRFERGPPRDFDRGGPRDHDRDRLDRGGGPRDFDRGGPRDFERGPPRDFDRDRGAGDLDRDRGGYDRAPRRDFERPDGAMPVDRDARDWGRTERERDERERGRERPHDLEDPEELGAKRQRRSLDGPGGPPLPPMMRGPPPGFGQLQPPPNLPFGSPGRVVVADPLAFDVLLTFKQFTDLQPGDIDPEDALRAYSDYKRQYTAAQIPRVFDTIKGMAWVAEKYHPAQMTARRAVATSMAQEAFGPFRDDWTSGALRTLALDDGALATAAPGSGTAAVPAAAAADKTRPEASSEPGELNDEQVLVQMDVDTVDPSKTERNVGETRLPALGIVLFKTLAPTITHAQVEELCKRYEGFLELEMGEVKPFQGFHRTAYAFYAPEVDIAHIVKELDNSKIGTFTLHLAVFKVNLNRGTLIHMAAAQPTRKRRDLGQATKLAAKLDQERGVSLESVVGPGLDADAATIEAVTERLDVTVYYLRFVHAFDYYSCREFQSLRALVRSCGRYTMRARWNDAAPDASHESVTHWEKILDAKITARLQTPLSTDEAAAIGLRDLKQEETKFVNENTVKEEEEKYRCNLCSKRFKGAEFTHKHIGLKHQDELAVRTAQLEMYNNYVCDAGRFTGIQSNPALAVARPGAPMAPMDVGGFMPPGGVNMGGPPRSILGPAVLMRPVPPMGDDFGGPRMLPPMPFAGGRPPPPGFGGGGMHRGPPMPPHPADGPGWRGDNEPPPPMFDPGMPRMRPRPDFERRPFRDGPPPPRRPFDGPRAAAPMDLTRPPENAPPLPNRPLRSYRDFDAPTSSSFVDYRTEGL